MGYFDTQEGVDEYTKMAEGSDGRQLIEKLKKHLKSGSTILELGMGPGKDLEILAEPFQVTGSDSSAFFLKRYRDNHPDADLMQLDAATMDTDRTFDCIYSNKVLQHLTKEELKESLRRQADVLDSHGLLFHSFWYGDKEEEELGLRFVYHSEASLARIIDDKYDIVDANRYAEIDDEDSMYVVLRKIG